MILIIKVMERNEEKKNIERSHEKDTMHQHQKVTTTPIARGSKKKIQGYRTLEPVKLERKTRTRVEKHEYYLMLKMSQSHHCATQI